MAERLDIHPDNPQPRFIQQALKILQGGGLIIYPTDTVYGLGCDLCNKRALQRIYQIKGSDKRKLLSFICPDLKEIARYAHVSNPAYKLMRHYTPGPYTFILEASREVPKILLEKRRTVGIRVPNNAVCQCLLKELGTPIISTSACLPGQEYISDPEVLWDLFYHHIDLFLDSGIGGTVPSTILDLTGDTPVVHREGKGKVDY
ncbi:MAG TPA: L-threonylcarbamoyladenylate synthase [bacterium]|jgi:tRNA threonylcarbamoyl adenosine modification protein (Sua5/YciO/YrdC/YwlC family)|nr:L-threonylcarbamoyladenylate synthase [bacterium]HNT64847.1 L-threonylcarbamoyladenylate synthase [bacterium]